MTISRAYARSATRGSLAQRVVEGVSRKDVLALANIWSGVILAEVEEPQSAALVKY